MAQAGSNSGAITLDELIALNDEIAALVRAGVPLEPALAELGGDLPGRLGRIVAGLAERTNRGESLLQALGDASLRMPPVYRAVVEAGLKSGRLPTALEALAGSIRRLAETRRGLATAAIYPLIVFLLAWWFFGLFCAKIAPSLLFCFERLDIPGGGVLGRLAAWGPSAVYWEPLIPLAVLAAAGTWWFHTGRASSVQPGPASRLIGWMPWMGPSLKWSRAATFVEVLALLVENGVPMHDGILLAAEASGDARVLLAARSLAAAVQNGETVDLDRLRAAGLPPLLSWLMGAGQRQGALLPALKHAAETYHRRAQHQADKARLLLPVVLTVVIGGGITLLYTLILFVPYATMLKTLSAP
ncbi:MAG: type II secretion system F family protein [Pirellulales bacterium]|nr:type II secretion system F family protein [Pirellulales bacterium]